MKLVYFSKRPYIFISKTIIPGGGGQGTKHKSCSLDHYLRKKKNTYISGISCCGSSASVLDVPHTCLHEVNILHFWKPVRL